MTRLIWDWASDVWTKGGVGGAGPRHSGSLVRKIKSRLRGRPEQSLNAGSITDSFSELGVICGVVGPTQSEMNTLRQADIVVLDWRLKEDDPRICAEIALVNY